MASGASAAVKNIAIVGGTGAYLGCHVTRAALAAGHKVTVLTRGRNERNAALYDEFEAAGATFASVRNTDIDGLTEVFKGKDVVFCFPGIDRHRAEQVRSLMAAKRAGVGRFVPDEFGCDTEAIPYGVCGMFDQKKDFATVCKLSGVPYTLMMNHAIATWWMMPVHFNQDGFRVIGTGDVKYIVTHKSDIATLCVKAACDERCANRAVSFNGGGAHSVNEMIAEVRKNFPDHTFEYPHVPLETVNEAARTASDVCPPGEQSPLERAQIDKLVNIDGYAAAIGQDTLRATDLWPEHKWVQPLELLKDPSFVFGEGNEP